MNNIKIAVTGASGMLGTAVIDYLSQYYTVFATSRSVGHIKQNIDWYPFDLLNQQALLDWLNQIRPCVVIHCAALVDVDGCEKMVKQAQLLHAEVTATIATEIVKWNGRLIYISTDAVFDGNYIDPYTENMATNPLNTYGKTKLLGEVNTLANPRNLVLRTNIFGWTRLGRLSFAEWILKGLIEQTRLTMFNDVFFTPIYVYDVAKVVAKIITQPIAGLYHLTGSTRLSKYEFTFKLAEKFQFDTKNIVPVGINDIALSAPRPKNMCLSNQKLSSILNIQLPNVEESILYFKQQYDNHWVKQIKKLNTTDNYHFWR